jgi:uncharacterized protein
MMRVRSGIWLAALAALAPAAAGADVKAGTEAWHRGDYPQAVAEWRGPAIAGDADAQFNMGQAYKLGRGVPTDLAQAEQWYAKAAKQGHPLAEDSYGLLLYQNGRGADALPWLQKSVARDERRAELVLGTMYFNGDGVERDYPRAYALVTRASQTGDPRMADVVKRAGETLAQMDGYLTPEQRQGGLAMASHLAEGAKAAPAPMPTANLTPAARPTARPRPTPMATPRAAPVAKTADAPKPAAPPKVAAGRYRIQLGAFKDEGNAKALWARVGGKTGGEPFYVRAGAITRLQAGPFASEGDAQRACRTAGVSCDVVREK